MRDIIYYSEERNVIALIGSNGTNGKINIRSSKMDHWVTLRQNQYNDIFALITKYYTFIGYV